MKHTKPRSLIYWVILYLNTNYSISYLNGVFPNYQLHFTVNLHACSNNPGFKYDQPSGAFHDIIVAMLSESCWKTELQFLLFHSYKDQPNFFPILESSQFCKLYFTFAFAGFESSINCYITLTICQTWLVQYTGPTTGSNQV